MIDVEDLVYLLRSLAEIAGNTERIAAGLERRNELLEERNKMSRAAYETNLEIAAAARRLEEREAAEKSVQP